jgi:predicted TPR repeat methyltransferase
MSIVGPAVSGQELLPRLREMIERNRVGAARPLLNALMRLMPPGAEIADLRARLLLLEGNTAGACAVLDEAITQVPDSVPLRLTRAQARGQAGDYAGAAQDSAEAVVLDPSKAQAKAALGVFLSRLHQHQDARQCLAEAVAMAPNDPGYRRNLAAAQAACGDEAAASATLEEGIARAPTDVALRTAAVLARMRRVDFEGAEALALAASQAGVADATLLGLLGHARSSLGRHDEAADAYAEARRLAPEDPYVTHLAAAGRHLPDAGRATTDYVRVVFDGYASRFDSHLIALGYRIPGLVRAELAQMPGRSGPVLDLGCGTGLLAVACVDTGIGPWIGADLSPGMLAEARKRGIYAELHESDVEMFLSREQRSFPIIVAGDLMPYFGDLAPVTALVAQRLETGGRFVFSVERLAEDANETRGWRLGRLGRYAHTAAHVRAAAAAAGLAVTTLRNEPVRLEAEVPVPGLFVTFERPRPTNDAATRRLT